jgi:predicted outer membrane protein
MVQDPCRWMPGGQESETICRSSVEYRDSMLVQYAKRLIRNVSAGLALVVLFIVFPERASSSPPTTSLATQDRAFLEDAALANLREIQFGKIAIEKAVDSEVRAFTSRNLSDYSRIRDAISSVATADQAPLPDHLSGEALRDYLRLIAIPRPWFDRLYVYMMFKWHAVAVRGYQEAAKTVTAPKLRVWTEQTLPLIQDQLESIKRIAIAKGVPMNSGDGQRTIPKY